MRMVVLVNNIRVNNEQSVFAVSSDAGFRLFWAYPLQQLMKIGVEETGTLKLCSLRASSNLIAMVSGGNFPKCGDNIVKIWNQVTKKFIGLYTLPMPIRNVIITSLYLIAVTDRQITFFSFPNGSTVYAMLNTGYNPNGLTAVSEEIYRHLLVVPDEKTGNIKVLHLSDLSLLRDREDIYQFTIYVDSTAICGLAINKEGTIVAVGCQLGKIIKLVDVRLRETINVLWRGADPANLHCLRFSPCSSFLGVTSDKDTLHIFKVTEQRRIPENQVFSNEGTCILRSFAKYSLPPSVFAELIFPSSDESSAKRDGVSVVAVCSNGHYYHLEFCLNGSVKVDNFDLYFETGDEQSFFDV